MAGSVGRGRWIFFAGSVALGLVTTEPASAADSPELDAEENVPRPALAIVSGGVTAVASLTAGSILMARGTTSAERNLGLLVAETGLYLTPIVSHAAVGELGRGALLALFPLAATIVTATLMSFNPTFVTSAPPSVQYPTFIAFGGSLLFSTFSILDAARVGERQRTRAVAGRPGLSLSALLDRDVKGVVLGGNLW